MYAGAKGAEIPAWPFNVGLSTPLSLTTSPGGGYVPGLTEWP